jgi:hypothetical protein
MPDIHDVMDVTIEEPSSEQQLQLKEAVDQFRQKCLMSFSKNRSGVPYLKSDMPRVLLQGEPDTTFAEEKQEVMNAVQQTMENIMAKHNTAVLHMFRQMMVSIFGPGMEKVLNRVSPQGPSGETGESSAGGQPIQQQNPYQAVPNRPTYGELAFGSSGVPPGSTYRIALANNRLQKNMYRGGYSEFMDYGAIDAFPNPGYGTATGMPTGPARRPGDQDAEVDLMVQKMADVLQNQFGLKPKNQGHLYTPPFLEWYNRVALPHRVKAPADFTKFFGQDDTSTVEHIARYLMQLGKLQLMKHSESDIPPITDRPGLYMVHFFACSLNLFLEGFGTKVSCSLCHWQ